MATIEKRVGKDGAVGYRVRIRIRGQHVTNTFPKLVEAKAWAADTEAGLRTGKRFSTQAQRRTVGDLVDYYLNEYLHSKARNRDAANYRRHLTWWKSRIGRVPLIDVTGELVLRHRKALLQTISQAKQAKVDTSSAIGGKSALGRGKAPRARGPATANRYVVSLSHAFSVGVRVLEWITQNPIRNVSKLPEPGGRVRFLSPEEIVALLKAAKASSNSALYPAVILALSTGMRKNEIMGLRRSEVDLGRAVIMLPPERTKTSKGRSIPLVGAALDALKAWIEAAEKIPRIDTDLVFPSSRGSQPLNIRVPWEKALQAAGIEDYRFHDNRHSAASYLMMTGASPIEVAGILGHSNVQMTARYSHMSDQHRRAVLERLNAEVFR
jgi:integrase